MRKLLALVLAATLSASMAFAGGSSEAAASKEPVKKDTLVVAVATEPTTLHPDTTSLVYDEIVLLQIYGNLIRYNQAMEFVPDLAESFKVLDDTHIQFKLRDNLKFSDGTPITSTDVAASILAVKNSKPAAVKAKWYDHLEIQDDKNFVLVTNAPSSSVLDGLASKCHIAPAKLLESGYDFNKAPVCSGPYMVKEWAQGQSITLVKNPEYNVPGREAKIPTISYRIIPEGVTRTISLEKGEIDFVYDVQASDLAELSANKKLVVTSSVNCAPAFLCFNTQRMSNENLRKAIAAGINRENASLIATGGYAKPLASGFAMGLLGSTEEGAVEYDPEAAKKYLAASGLTPDQLKFDVVVKEPAFELAMQSAQADLKTLGIDITIRTVDSATYNALSGGNGTYDMMMARANYAELTGAMGGITSKNAYNQSRLNDPWIDEMVAKAGKTTDTAEREKMLKSIIAYVNKNTFRTGIYQMVNTRAYSADLQGFESNMLGYDCFNMLSWK